MSYQGLISVIVTTYNRSDALVRVLEALDQQTDSHFEVVVADDGSSDSHVQVSKNCCGRLQVPMRHVWHPDVGFTAGSVRNLGVTTASGDYLIFLDGDCIPEIDFVASHRRLARSHAYVNGSRVLMGVALSTEVVQGRQSITSQASGWWLWQRIFGQINKAFPKCRWLALPRFAQKEFVWRGIRSCNMGVWRSDFEHVNGFDTSFVGWGHEDADFVLRLHNAGVVRINGFWATEVYHLWHVHSDRGMSPYNAQKVHDRIASQMVRAERGYAQGAQSLTTIVSRWR